MRKIESFDEVEKLRSELQKGRDPNKPCMTVCVGTGCLAYGTQKLVDNLKTELAKRNLEGKIDLPTLKARLEQTP